MKALNTGSCERCTASLVGMRVDARYCSKRCRMLSTKRRLKVNAGKFIGGATRNCLECQKPFPAKFARNTYCSEVCGRAAYKRQSRTGTLKRNCTICSTEFTPNSSVHWLCSKACISVRQRHQRLATRYGLTADAFEDLLHRQRGGCAICETRESDRWAVDHDHACCDGDSTCGKCIRGILCFPCNQALGLLRDSPENLKRALSYLTGSNEPGQAGSVYGHTIR